MSDKDFGKGIIVKPPHEKAPDFVKCTISIKRVELMEWLAGKSDEWVNLDVKEGKTGKWYTEVNTWKRDANLRTNEQPKPKTEKPGFVDDPLPF